MSMEYFRKKREYEVKRKINVCLVGCGNITMRRHIPAFMSNDAFNIYGVIGVNKIQVDDAYKLSRAEHKFYVKGDSDPLEIWRQLDWFNEVDVVVIGTPPRTHYELTKAALLLNKDLLVEKPFTVSMEEATELVDLAKSRNRIAMVMHNFQFGRGAQRLEKVLASGKLGTIRSFELTQSSTKERNLPSWYQDLPLGLFYDEGAHFCYMLERFGGELVVEDAFAFRDAPQGDNTPRVMGALLTAGGVPAVMKLNFDAPVSEWFFTVIGENQMAIYDYFRDILVILPRDGTHSAVDILRTSFLATFRHWIGFFESGLLLIRKRLYWGTDIVVERLRQSIQDRVVDPSLDISRGLEVVRAMLEISRACEDGKNYSRLDGEDCD